MCLPPMVTLRMPHNDSNTTEDSIKTQHYNYVSFLKIHYTFMCNKVWVFFLSMNY
jgi:hypothetical protein